MNEKSVIDDKNIKRQLLRFNIGEVVTFWISVIYFSALIDKL